jgi:phage FluMu gp28-like protein
MARSVQSPLDLLLPYQRRWYDDKARFKCGLWSRQTGKDFTTSGEAVADCLQRPGTTWMIAAPSERQSLETLQKCKEWSEAFSLAIADVLEERPSAGALLKSATIHYDNRSRIIAVPGRPDTVRGFSANVLLTEFGFFEDPEATWRAIYPSISNPLRGGEKVMRVISTPNGKSGAGARLFRIVDENLLNPRPERKAPWNVHKVTILDAVADGLPFDVEQLRAGIDDETAWAQEYMCEFLDTANVLLPYDLIALAESAGASETCDLTVGGMFFVGIDYGRVNDPSIAWTLEQCGDVLVTREVLVMKGLSTPRQEELLRPRIERASRVCHDYTGPGIGLGDYLVKQFGEFKPDGHTFGKVELCTFTTGFKREIFPRLRRGFEAPTKLRIPISVEIREDLHAMQQIVRNGEYTYAAPRTAEGHSDRCTALALAVRAADSGAIPGKIVPFATRRGRALAELREVGVFA